MAEARQLQQERLVQQLCSWSMRDAEQVTPEDGPSTQQIHDRHVALACTLRAHTTSSVSQNAIHIKALARGKPLCQEKTIFCFVPDGRPQKCDWGVLQGCG